MAKHVVVADNYEYNDEYYEEPEHEAYRIATKLYDTKKEAQDVANELNKTRGWWGATGNYEDDYEGEDVKRNPQDPSEIWIEPYRVVTIDE